MNQTNFVLRGDVVYSQSPTALNTAQNAFLVCEEGRVAGVFATLPRQYEGFALRDTGGALIIPGFTDLHLHAPQYAFCGLGMDLELLEWLNTRTFPQEARYADMAYAQKAYAIFAGALKRSATCRAAVFATIHTPATLLLMDLLEESGLVTMVGRVNMDRNAIPALEEPSAAEALAETRRWLEACAKKGYRRTAPILTPRFVPSCSDELLQGLGQLQRESGLAVQSHLSENKAEVEWVKQLCPGAESYADAYRQFGLFGGEGVPTIMAHCVHSQGKEVQLLAENGVYVAHCPVSNACLSSGIAPVRSFLQMGVPVGLGTDVAGGYELSLFGVMAQAVMSSKLRWRLVDDSLPPLTMREVFYMATKGGGSFFGKVGSFEEGYAFDALVLDDKALKTPLELGLEERLERLVYLGTSANIAEKYVEGRRVK